MPIVVPAIPASEIVQIIPGVVGAGGTAAELLGLCLTDDERAPIGQALTFPSAAAVSEYFGSGTQMDALASIYFLGFDNSLAKPNALIVKRFPRENTSAYLRGAGLGLTLAQLQAISGSLNVVIDGVTHSGVPDLSSVTSFSNAATEIASALDVVSGVELSEFTGSISGTTMNVTGVISGTLTVGSFLTGSDINPGTYIASLGTGTGGTGTYVISPSQVSGLATNNSFEAGVEYDSVQDAFVIHSALTGTGSTIGFASGVMSTDLKLTETTGAVISPGVIAQSPGSFMDELITETRNWFTFFTSWQPAQGVLTNFAEWVNSQGNLFAYSISDPSVADTAAGGPGVAWADIREAEYSGVVGMYDDPDIDPTSQQMAAFAASYPASLDFNQTQGRTTFAFRRQSGLPAQIKSQTKARYLESYGLNYYGSFTTDNDQFTGMYPGFVTGPFLWFDSYTNQAWFNRQLQLAAMAFMFEVRSIPYNQEGYALIEAALLDPILTAVNFGAIQAGVTLSEAQKAQVNNAAGVKIDDVLRRRGWYLQVKDASAQVRQARGSPPCTLWYTDGQSVQRINLSSFSVL